MKTMRLGVTACTIDARHMADFNTAYREFVAEPGIRC